MSTPLPEPKQSKKMCIDGSHDYIDYYTEAQVTAYGDAKEAEGYKRGIEDAAEACKQADLKYDAKGERLTLTAAHHIINALGAKS